MPNAEPTTAGRILVTGATGTVGGEVLRLLAARNEQVVAASRDPRAQAWPAGVEAVRFDVDDPGTAAPALRGIDRLFLIRPPQTADIRRAFGPVAAALRAGAVRHVVVLSVQGANPVLPHWRLERLIAATGVPVSALRPAYFAQNLVTAFGAEIREHDRLTLASGRGRVAFVDTRDVAEVAARLLLGKLPPARALTLTGPAALGFGEVAKLLTAELGRPIAYRRLGLLQRRRELLRAGASPGFVRVQLVIDATDRLGLAARVDPTLATLLGRPATPIDRVIHDLRDAWR